MIALIIQIFIYSFIATAWFLPISSLDVYYVATFDINAIWYILPVVILVEVINANIVYKFSYILSKWVIRKEKTKKKLEIITEKVDKMGFWGIVLVGATPLPYSLVLYSAGVVQWGSVKKFSLAVLIGRSIKYIALAIVAYFGFSILNI